MKCHFRGGFQSKASSLFLQHRYLFCRRKMGVASSLNLNCKRRQERSFSVFSAVSSNEKEISTGNTLGVIKRGVLGAIIVCCFSYSLLLVVSVFGWHPKKGTNLSRFYSFCFSLSPSLFSHASSPLDIVKVNSNVVVVVVSCHGHVDCCFIDTCSFGQLTVLF